MNWSRVEIFLVVEKGSEDDYGKHTGDAPMNGRRGLG
jgi:hypothetical protein